MAKLTGIELVHWLECQVKLARERKRDYLLCRACYWPGLWTMQVQQVFDGICKNLAYFENELREARYYVCSDGVGANFE